ncbi:MAG: hypothetical protein NC416_03040 [Eubacterium sp.]|nr:hypothetical protein [Eubacterium sp.]
MNQYKKETSQIHAPEALILKTKQAVREEEKRIQQEKVLHTDKVQQAAKSITEDAGLRRADKTGVPAEHAAGQSKSSYVRIYKWALPVAAAVLLAVLMNASIFLIGNRSAKSRSDSSAGMPESAAAGGAEYEAVEEEAAVEEFDDMDGGAGQVFVEEDFSEESVGAADESGSSYDMLEESVAEAPAGVTSEEVEYKNSENAVNEFAVSEDAASDLFIEEVKEIPSFCDDQNTECITSHGLQFYVARQRGNKWKAYVSVDDTGYLITGSSEEISKRESFAQMAYELLAETVEGME